MDFNEYQKEAWKTAIHPNKGNNWIYPAIGLGGEAGEVLNKLKKILRDGNHHISDEKKSELSDEIGDVLWYLAGLCTELKLDLGKVAEDNIAKLLSRFERGKLYGSGDNR